ncbi:hypothetical protein K488DRAFT_67945 [Vararia minispora EC-137]|uniref:Uncharacterized protein n=1 Tax=Vararia minispora EC-137 TaxID=1314806 RepID=A0ACB8QW43_9AGAM|nr:hypothetical protein K488DRAFT_67945 [Vararia minispora EC-137]
MKTDVVLHHLSNELPRILNCATGKGKGTAKTAFGLQTPQSIASETPNVPYPKAGKQRRDDQFTVPTPQTLPAPSKRPGRQRDMMATTDTSSKRVPSLQSIAHGRIMPPSTSRGRQRPQTPPSANRPRTLPNSPIELTSSSNGNITSPEIRQNNRPRGHITRGEVIELTSSENDDENPFLVKNKPTHQQSRPSLRLGLSSPSLSSLSPLSLSERSTSPPTFKVPELPQAAATRLPRLTQEDRLMSFSPRHSTSRSSKSGSRNHSQVESSQWEEHELRLSDLKDKGDLSKRANENTPPKHAALPSPMRRSPKTPSRKGVPSPPSRRAEVFAPVLDDSPTQPETTPAKSPRLSLWETPSRKAPAHTPWPAPLVSAVDDSPTQPETTPSKSPLQAHSPSSPSPSSRRFFAVVGTARGAPTCPSLPSLGSSQTQPETTPARSPRRTLSCVSSPTQPETTPSKSQRPDFPFKSPLPSTSTSCPPTYPPSSAPVSSSSAQRCATSSDSETEPESSPLRPAQSMTIHTRPRASKGDAAVDGGVESDWARQRMPPPILPLRQQPETDTQMSGSSIASAVQDFLGMLDDCNSFGLDLQMIDKDTQDSLFFE